MRPLSSTKTALRGRLEKHTDVTKRKSSGIKGLDELIAGGFPNHFAVLLLGPRGCSKTIFGNQVLWEGLKNGERGIILAYDQSPNEIRRSMASFGWDVTPYQNENKFAIIDCFNGAVGIDSHEKYYVRDPRDVNQVMYTIDKCLSEVVSNGENLRIFMDSGTTFGNMLRTRIDNIMKMPISLKISRRLHSYIKKYNVLGVLSLHRDAQNKVFETLAKQLIDGVIEVDKRTENGRVNHYLQISKMSMTNRSKTVHPYTINNYGITVLRSKTIE